MSTANMNNDTHHITVMIENRRGLHARAAAKLAKLAEKFSCTISVARADMCVPATSIMGLMMLAATPGSEITVEAKGENAQLAIAEIKALIERKFDEE